MANVFGRCRRDHGVSKLGRFQCATTETMSGGAHKFSVALLHLRREPVTAVVWGRRRYALMIKHDYRPAKNKPVTADRSRSGG